MRFRSGISCALVALLLASGASAQETGGSGVVGATASAIIGGALLGNLPRYAPRPDEAQSQARARAPLRNADRHEIQATQTALNSLGFDAGTPDGLPGARTRAAILAFQRFLETPATGALNPVERRILALAAAESAGGAGRDYAIGLAVGRFCGSLGFAEADCLDTAGVPAFATQYASAVPAAADGASQLAAATPDPVLASVAIPVAAATEAAAAAAVPPASAPTQRSIRFSEGPTPAIPTRMFAGPTQYPPAGYRGYGIIAFKSEAAGSDALRYSVICEAFNAAMLASTAIANPPAAQFVTIWPIVTDATADHLNATSNQRGAATCDEAIDAYDRLRAEEVLLAARAAGFEAEGIGPFLFGWLPGDRFGARDALILSLDLSQVRSYGQAQALFTEWKTDIMSDPELLEQGFSLELVRRKIRRWADSYGDGFLSVLGG